MIAATPTLVPGIVPVQSALAAVRRRRGPESTRGLVPGLIVPDGAAGWLPAAQFLAEEQEQPGGWGLGGLSRRGLDDLLDAAKQRWGATPHVAAALAWRSYTYWLAMPVVLGWATARRVLLVEPDDVLVQISVTHDKPLLTMGLRRVRMAVLPDDPAPPTGATVVGSEDELLRALRTTLREHHLDLLLERIRSRVNLGARTLLGSLASAVAYGVVRGADAPAAAITATADTLLTALDVADLVDLQPGPDGIQVKRRTCCLAFTLPVPKVCSGCCLQLQS